MAQDGAGLSQSVPQPNAPDTGSMVYPNVDFDTGLPFLDRTHLAQADNFQEKKQYLERVYGKKSVEVDQDPYGEPMLVVVKDGKKIAAEGGGGFENFAANVVGSSPEWLAMGAGGVLGAAVGGPVGAVAGAALGAGIGKESTEIEKQVSGDYNQSATEAAGNAGRSVVGGATGEMGGKLLTSGISRVLRGPLPNLVSQTTPETRALTERTLAGGARPSMQSAVPGAKKLQWTEALSNKVSGRNVGQDTANSDYIEGRMRTVLKESGIPDNAVDAVMKELRENDSKIATSDIGEHVKVRVDAHRKMLSDATEKITESINKDVDEKLAHLDTLTRRYKPGDLGVDVSNGIKKARADFGKAMSKGYSKIDQLVGDQPVVDTSIPVREAKSLLRQLPKSGKGPLVHETAGLEPEADPNTEDDKALYESFGIKPPEAPSGKVKFADAHRLRTEFRAKSDELNLTKDPKAAMAARMADMWDYAIQAAGTDPAVAPAVRLLNHLDATYAKGIAKFNDSTIRSLVANLHAGLPPDPETIAAQIVKPGQEARVKEIRKLVGESVWKRVAGADYSRMVQASTDETGQIDGIKLLAQIKQRGKAMAVTYGDNVSKQIETLARTTAMRDGKLPIAAVQPGRVDATLHALQQSQAAEERFMRESYLGQLHSRRAPEGVYKWLVRPDNSQPLTEAIRMFGADSPEIRGVRQAALRELLTQTKMSAADSGRAEDALSKALAMYSPEQQKLLFPGGMADDLHLLAKEVKFLMPKPSDESKASFAAGAILGSPLMIRVPLQVVEGFTQAILSHPKVIRYLALGLRSPPGPARRAARSMLENLVRYGSISGTVRQGDPDDQQTETQPSAGNGEE